MECLHGSPMLQTIVPHVADNSPDIYAVAVADYGQEQTLQAGLMKNDQAKFGRWRSAPVREIPVAPVASQSETRGSIEHDLGF